MEHFFWLLGICVFVAIVAMLVTVKASQKVVAQHLADGATVIDVRTREAYAEAHYPPALHIPLDLLPSKLHELGPRKTPIILYCDSGMLAGSARIILLRAGFLHVHNAGAVRDVELAAARAREMNSAPPSA